MQMFKWAHIGPVSGTTHLLWEIRVAVGRFDLASPTLNASMKSTALGMEDTLHISLMRPDGCL